MKKNIGISVLIVVGIFLLIAVGFLLWRMTGTVNVGGTELDVTKKLDGGTTVKSDYGTSTYGTNKLPDNWPSDAPVYPNATITFAAATNAQAGVEGYEVMFTTSDSVQTVLDFYKSELTSLGWVSMYSSEPITGVQVGGITGVSAKKDKRSITIGITDTGNEKRNVIIVMTTRPEIKSGL